MSTESTYQVELKKLDNSPIQEQVVSGTVNGVKAGFAGIPFIGGTINSLMNDYIPNFKFERLKKIVFLLSKEIENIKDQLNEDYMKTEEFAYYFELSIKKSMDEYDEEKRRYYMGFLLNNMNNKINRPNYEKDFYLNLIESLTPLQLKMIRFLQNPEQYFIDEKIDSSNVHEGNFGTSFSSMFKIAFAGINKEIVKKSFSRLNQMGLTNTDEHIFGTMTSNNGFTIVKGRLSLIASEFIAFCKTYSKS